MLSITVLLPQNWSEKDLLNILKAQNNHYSCQLHKQLQYKETGIVGIVFQISAFYCQVFQQFGILPWMNSGL